MYLSKSQYIRGKQCAKSLWLLKHRPELLAKPTPSQVAAFAGGRSVESYAHELFSRKAKIDFHKIDFNEGSFTDKATKTKELLQRGECCIAEATFIYDGILVMVDILESHSNSVIINEIKSSTSVKNVYIKDVALQYFVLQNLGLEVVGANIWHINNTYERDGELELEKLFTKVDVLQDVQDMQSQIAQDLKDFETMLQNPCPEIDIGSHCSDPYECDFSAFCWEHIPKEDSIFNLTRFSKKWEFYKQGVINLREIDNLTPFNARQRIQIESLQSATPHIDKGAIKAFLQDLRYPIYHLDFETFTESVPSFNRQRPYMQIPFQYSLHIEYEDGRLEHREFLALDSSTDPREALLRSLLDSIPSDAFLLAYNASFESGVLEHLAKLFPEQKDRIQNMRENLYDLMQPFASFAYYHPKQNGSYSIKKVLPSLVPEMQEAYKDLALVHNGGEAMETFCALRYLPDSQKEAIRCALLAYCRLDTLAMVEIVKKLREIAG